MLGVVLAGGRGTRLWPLSTPERPKHLLELRGRALVAHAVDRLRPLGDVVVLTAPDLLDATAAVVPGVRVIVEPAPRGTGPAVALALVTAEQAGADVVVVAPSDHFVEDAPAFVAAIHGAVAASRASGRVGVLGIAAIHPDTGLGWIEAPGPGPVSRFVEKPDADTARDLLARGAWWNAGVFVVPVAAASAIDRRLPGALPAGRAWLAGDAAPWIRLEASSFDRAFLEHEPSDVTPCACGWSDLGTFESLARAGVHLEAPTDHD